MLFERGVSCIPERLPGGERASVSARVIRDLMLGRLVLVGELDPDGIQLCDVAVTGALDLAHIPCPVRLSLIDPTVLRVASWTVL